MTQIINHFTDAAQDTGTKIRPLGSASDYVADTLPKHLSALEQSQPEAKRQLLQGIYEALQHKPKTTDPVCLLDLKMLYVATLRACALRPDDADIHTLRRRAEMQIARTDPQPAIFIPTYEDIVLNNPVNDMRVFTTGETGRMEAGFYRAHRMIESRLQDAIDNIQTVLESPADINALNIAARAMITVRQSMASFHRDLPPEQFMAFKPYFDTNPFRHEKGPSGAFSAKVQHLIILLHGHETPPDRLAYIDENAVYFPSTDLAALRRSQDDGRSLQHLVQNGKIDPRPVAAIAGAVLGFLQSHRHTVAKHMGVDAKGSAEQDSATDFLSDRVTSYKQAVSTLKATPTQTRQP